MRERRRRVLAWTAENYSPSIRGRFPLPPTRAAETLSRLNAALSSSCSLESIVYIYLSMSRVRKCELNSPRPQSARIRAPRHRNARCRFFFSSLRRRGCSACPGTKFEKPRPKTTAFRFYIGPHFFSPVFAPKPLSRVYSLALLSCLLRRFRNAHATRDLKSFTLVIYAFPVYDVYFFSLSRSGSFCKFKRRAEYLQNK